MSKALSFNRITYNTLSAYEISLISCSFSFFVFCFHESRILYQMRLQWKSSISDVVAVASFFCDLAPQLGCWLAARQMHIVMLRAVMRAPLTFFDTTPIGRIISRFAKDVDVLDTSLPPQISDTIYCLFEVISFVALPRIASWDLLIIAFPYLLDLALWVPYVYYPPDNFAYILDCDRTCCPRIYNLR